MKIEVTGSKQPGVLKKQRGCKPLEQAGFVPSQQEIILSVQVGKQPLLEELELLDEDELEEEPPEEEEEDDELELPEEEEEEEQM